MDELSYEALVVLCEAIITSYRYDMRKALKDNDKRDLMRLETEAEKGIVGDILALYSVTYDDMLVSVLEELKDNAS